VVWPRCHLLDHVQLAQHVFLLASGRWSSRLRWRAHVLHVAQPVVGQADAGVAHRRAHAAAAVVAHHDDVLTFSASTANWITDSAFRSECTTTLATLRCTNTSPGQQAHQ
jgi:hypothetical protein